MTISTRMHNWCYGILRTQPCHFIYQITLSNIADIPSRISRSTQSTINQ